MTLQQRHAELVAASRQPNPNHKALDQAYRLLELDRIEALRVQLSSKLVDAIRLRAVAA